MTTINVDGQNSSFNHLELWGETDSGDMAYMRYRSGVLEIRLSDSWSDEEANINFISADEAHTVFTRELDEGQYSELKQRYDDWDDVLDGEPYSVTPARF